MDKHLLVIILCIFEFFLSVYFWFQKYSLEKKTINYVNKYFPSVWNDGLSSTIKEISRKEWFILSGLDLQKTQEAQTARHMSSILVWIFFLCVYITQNYMVLYLTPICLSVYFYYMWLAQKHVYGLVLNLQEQVWITHNKLLKKNDFSHQEELITKLDLNTETESTKKV